MGLAAIIGTSVHTGIEVALRYEVNEGAPLSIPVAIRAGVDAYDERLAKETPRTNDWTKYTLKRLVKALTTIKDRGSLKKNEAAIKIASDWFNDKNPAPLPWIRKQVETLAAQGPLSIAQTALCARTHLEGKPYTSLADDRTDAKAVLSHENIVTAWANQVLVNPPTERIGRPFIIHEIATMICAALTWWAESPYEILDAEQRLVYDAETSTRLGYCDARVLDPRTGAEGLLDWKTKGASPPEGKADRTHAIAMNEYAEACDVLGIPVTFSVLVYVIRGSLNIVEAPVDVSDASREWAQRIITDAENLIRHGRLSPNPIGAGNLCSPDFCDFWDGCIASPSRAGY